MNDKIRQCKKTARPTFRITQDLYDKLAEEAKLRGISRNAVLSIILNRTFYPERFRADKTGI